MPLPNEAELRDFSVLSRTSPLLSTYSGFLNLEVALESCFWSLEGEKKNPKEMRGFWSILSLFKKEVILSTT